MEIKIYHLSCPVTGEIKYIGGTTDRLQYRLNGHINDKTNKRKREWIQWLVKIGKRPIITEIESVIYFKSRERENYWISFYKKKFDIFTNKLSSVNSDPYHLSARGYDLNPNSSKNKPKAGRPRN